MKKLILLILIFILLIQLSLAICCDDEAEKPGGCYPNREICCERDDKMVGFIGCKFATEKVLPETGFDYHYLCPGITLPHCLKCSDECKPNGNDCEWETLDPCPEFFSCYIEYTDTTEEIPVLNYYSPKCSDKCGEGFVWDPIQGICVIFTGEELCDSDDCVYNKWCCKSNGDFCTPEQESEGCTALCSGDKDNDLFCDFYDVCPNIKDDQTDSDNDGIGDACEFEGLCESPYGDRQCCDDLEGAHTGMGEFYGHRPDCPDTGENTIGCWSSCLGNYGDDAVIYEVGPCIDGIRTIKLVKVILDPETGKIIQKLGVIKTIKDSCAGIPLIPFFTTINLLITFLILFLFYYFRER